MTGFVEHVNKLESRRKEVREWAGLCLPCSSVNGTEEQQLFTRQSVKRTVKRPLVYKNAEVAGTCE